MSSSTDILNDTFKVAEDIISRTNQDGTCVLMRMDDSSVFFKIDGVAAEIWQEIAKGQKASEILDQLAQKHSVEKSIIEQDTKKFLEEILGKNFIAKA
ncbi:MAG: PqqD family protein [Deltaproteobacteria bacterium]|nr:MAG: PqqD family protein [Deltaproteobacteria bacterium]